jgi:hypothetical protein
MDTPGMTAWRGAWKKRHSVSKRSDLDRRVGRNIEVAALRIAEMAAREPDRWKRRSLEREARRFAFNSVYT